MTKEQGINLLCPLCTRVLYSAEMPIELEALYCEHCDFHFTFDKKQLIDRKQYIRRIIRNMLEGPLHDVHKHLSSFVVDITDEEIREEIQFIVYWFMR